MKYKNAQEILPAKLVEEIQKYASGKIIYIPKPKQNRTKWGTLSGSREYINKRNQQIKVQYKKGVSIDSLAKEYYLSIESIKKIIYTK